MLKAIHTKIMLGILAALIAIGAELVHIHNASERAAAILQQQQDGAAAAKKHDAETWEFVRKQHLKNDSNPVNGSHTWTHYLP